ncbi:MAG: hypothetical protein KJ718_06425 [Nanoarchaeota archaeon]|nr:hypothetical protein [Nanoarchaeota archaeon]MBU1052153.1 hypothetical protein [Nanoarchaeota archaeon]MBU1988120.1 hypothetical protein [Nanoarchaeota archaeon]
MRNIKGYVCLADVHTGRDYSIQILYGRHREGKVLFGNVEGNDFAVFDSEEERDCAARGVEQFSFVERVRPALLEMRIAESDEDVETLKDEGSLAVVALDSNERYKQLVGPVVDGRPSLDGKDYALMRLTNYTPFNLFEEAEKVAKGIGRQNWIVAFGLEVGE